MTEETENDVLQRLVHELQAEGYEVFLQPNRQLVPDFLSGYIPDVIALRSDKNLVFEIIRKTPATERKIEGLAQRFRDRKDWELRVVWITPASAGKELQILAPDLIRAHIAEIRRLTESGQLSSALLLAWATLEAVGRILISRQFQRPQTPGRLVQVLASEGYLTPTEADELRSLAEKRNRLIHGELNTVVTKEELKEFTDTLTAMLQLA